MIDHLIKYDRDLFRFLNGFHNPWLDSIMPVLTETEAWIPLYAFMLYVVVKACKWETWVILLGLALTILLADQITASIMKPYFERLRPSQDPTLNGLIHLVEGYKGGRFGFASSHAANTFGAATFFFLSFRKTKPWMILLFLWAALVSFTRIYLGVHYPGDIIAGAFVGGICGWVSYKIAHWLRLWAEKRRLASSG